MIINTEVQTNFRKTAMWLVQKKQQREVKIKFIADLNKAIQLLWGK